MVKRKALDRRRRELHASAARAVGLGKNQSDMMAGLDQAAQGDSGKIRSTGEDDFHFVNKEGQIARTLLLKSGK